METGFSTEGIIFMSVAWGIIAILTTYCLIKVFKTDRSSKDNN